MSAFNPESFMNSTVSEANSTQYEQVPEGEFSAAIDTVTPRTTGTGKALLSVKWKVDDEGVRTTTGMAEPSVFQTVWLDVTESGGLDFSRGKNVQLGKLRDALGQNAPGKPWSPGQDPREALDRQARQRHPERRGVGRYEALSTNRTTRGQEELPFPPPSFFGDLHVHSRSRLASSDRRNPCLR
jgi:hypothetical protein